MSDNSLATAKIAYDHLVLTRQIDDDAHKVYVDKVDRLLTKHLLIFAALGFGLTRIGWVDGWWWLPVGFLGGAAGLALAVASWMGLWSLRIGTTEVVGISALHEDLLKKDRIAQLGSAELTKQLAQNLADTIEKNRVRAKARGRLMPWLNWLTGIGYGLAVAFLAVVITGNTLTHGGATSDREGHAAAVDASE